MSDMDDDLSRFLEDEDDNIRPIEVKGDAAMAQGGGEDKPRVPRFEESDLAGDDIPQPVFEPVFGDAQQSQDELVLSNDFLDDIEREDERRRDLLMQGSVKERRNISPLLSDHVTHIAEEGQEADEAGGQILPPSLEDDRPVNFIKRGEDINLNDKRPGLSAILIGSGWEQRAFEGEPLDVDLSLFLLNRDNQTREDGDFVFYNHTRSCDGAVRYNYDSRTGAGDGDDETIDIDLNGVPYDILRIAIVLSIYDPNYDELNFSQVKDVYMRIVDKADGQEIFRYVLEDDFLAKGNAVIMGMLAREGAKWVFEASTGAPITGGLAKLATDYGIIVKELQSSGGE